MVTVTSLSDTQAAYTVAQRKVEQTQTQVQQDSDRLAQSESQLNNDRDQLRQTERANRVAQQAAPAAAPVRIDSALALSAPQAQLNTRGETIGSLINVLA